MKRTIHFPRDSNNNRGVRSETASALDCCISLSSCSHTDTHSMGGAVALERPRRVGGTGGRGGGRGGDAAKAVAMAVLAAAVAAAVASGVARMPVRGDGGRWWGWQPTVATVMAVAVGGGDGGDDGDAAMAVVMAAQRGRWRGRWQGQWRGRRRKAAAAADGGGGGVPIDPQGASLVGRHPVGWETRKLVVSRHQKCRPTTVSMRPVSFGNHAR